MDEEAVVVDDNAVLRCVLVSVQLPSPSQGERISSEPLPLRGRSSSSSKPTNVAARMR